MGYNNIKIGSRLITVDMEVKDYIESLRIEIKNAKQSSTRAKGINKKLIIEIKELKKIIKG